MDDMDSCRLLRPRLVSRMKDHRERDMGSEEWRDYAFIFWTYDGQCIVFYSYVPFGLVWMHCVVLVGL
ncbi:hypothetical protein BS78_01G004200 [Paspalum vaginatum]|nr:hypothetical protein BS78_01G004200 [Paspalum vaginatum]